MRHGYGICEVAQRGEGFGSIDQDGGGADVFARYSAISSSGFRAGWINIYDREVRV